MDRDDNQVLQHRLGEVTKAAEELEYDRDQTQLQLDNALAELNALKSTELDPGQNVNSTNKKATRC